jgi:glycerol-3-phosphate dehydrogenase
MQTHETDVLVIGGGVTGAGIMRDLALRGIRCILVDKRDLNGGASGGNHGLLHSGARYAVADTETATECRVEGDILKRLAPHCIDDCGGLYVAVEGDDLDYVARFPGACDAAGIPCEDLTFEEARRREPALPDTLVAAYAVPDATIDPFRLALENVSHAEVLIGSRYLPHIAVDGFEIADGRIVAAKARDLRSGEEVRIAAAQVVNAGGAWAGKIARMAGCEDVNVLGSKGSLIISNTRLSNGVISRLRQPDDGDLLVPGGTVSILGTSSVTITDPDGAAPTIEEVDHILDEGIPMLPIMARTRWVRAYCGVRPLLMVEGAEEDGRKAGRGFRIYDHRSQGLDNFCTVAGGKLTTFRLMAEKTVDLVASRLGVTAPCLTATEPLPAGPGAGWTAPGASARDWMARADATDTILCECEMVARSTVDQIVAEAPGHESHMRLEAISRRSRIGKGACQGAFCAMRVTSHLYDTGVADSPRGLADMRSFITERYKGVRPVLWGAQMPQTELAEILHVGLAGLDMADDTTEDGA